MKCVPSIFGVFFDFIVFQVFSAKGKALQIYWF